MTGIERLREYARRMDELHVWPGGAKLLDIADQIEREARASGAREMAALGAVDVSMSAYDLLPADEREAIAWVREHGGLENVRDAWDEAVNLCATIGCEPNDESEMLQALGDCTDIVIKRLMPEGCEWPRYESGDLVMFGDCAENRNGTCTVNSVRFYSGGGVTVYGEGRGAQFVVVTEPVMHDPIRKATPKVPAADGEPLEVGQTVWDTDAESDTPLTVVDVSSDLIWCEYTWKDGKTYRPCYPPSDLTHTRPVLDADDVPIKKGDTVWWLEHTGAFTVVSPHETHDNDGHELKCGHTVEIAREGHRPHMYVHPESLHHTKPEPPDTWERIEEDAKSADMRWFDDDVSTASDLVRRCRALAEREGGER